MDGIIYYFIIHDLNLIGKMEDYVDYIYDNKQGWVPDKEHILSDRTIGYDGESIGSSDMLFRVDEIPEEEAMKLIENM